MIDGIWFWIYPCWRVNSWFLFFHKSEKSQENSFLLCFSFLGWETDWLAVSKVALGWANKGKLFYLLMDHPRCGEGNGTPLQYSCLENPMDGGAWWAAVHGVTNSRRRLSDFTFTFHFHALEKEMATHSSVLAWRIPGTGEPGGLPSMGSHRVGHDWSDLAAAAPAAASQVAPVVKNPPFQYK